MKRRPSRIPSARLIVLAALGSLAMLAGCSKDSETNCDNTPTAVGCAPAAIASATLTVFTTPKVVGDTTIGIATASSTRGFALAEPTYNGAVIATAANPALILHAPAAGTAVYGARPVQAGATLRNALEQTFTVAVINATSTIDKTSIALGEFVRVSVSAQVGRDSVVVFEGGVRRASLLEGGGSVTITPAAVGTTTITTTGFNGPVTQTGTAHTVTVR